MATNTNPKERAMDITVVTNRKGELVAHRSTCKRISGDPAQDTQGGSLKPASCCKPTTTMLLAYAAQHNAEQQGAVSTKPEPKANSAAKAAAVAATQPDAIEVTDAASSQDRNKAARAEAKALKAWTDGGQKGARPSTPNLDALKAEYEAGVKPKVGKKGAGKPRTEDHPRVAKAKASYRAANNQRGRGKSLTDEDLAEYIAGVKAAEYGTGCVDELWVAHWTEGLAVSRGRWAKVWETVPAPHVEQPKANGKAA